MFWALVHDRVETRGFRFEHELKDMQTLSRWALEGKLEMTCMSFFAYTQAWQHYRLLATGVSFGHGYGPRLVIKPGTTPEQVLAGPIAIPGPLTTAYLISQLWARSAGRAEYPALTVPFDQVLPALLDGRAVAALVIHEQQLTFADMGLELLVDLGEWWKEQTGLSLPLGVNALRRDLGVEAAGQVATILDDSIRLGLENRKEALHYAMQFGRGIDPELGDEFVGMYVNESTLKLGEQGEAALRELLLWSQRAGLCPTEVPLDLVRAGSISSETR
jgi:1,4-dihydroxy-6-naphthoate synthase